MTRTACRALIIQIPILLLTRDLVTHAADQPAWAQITLKGFVCETEESIIRNDVNSEAEAESHCSKPLPGAIVMFDDGSGHAISVLPDANGAFSLGPLTIQPARGSSISFSVGGGGVRI